MIKQPCTKDCPDRCAECHTFCSDYKIYEEQKKKEYEQRKQRSQQFVPIPRTVLYEEKRRMKR